MGRNGQEITNARIYVSRHEMRCPGSKKAQNLTVQRSVVDAPYMAEGARAPHTLLTVFVQNLEILADRPELTGKRSGVMAAEQCR